MTRSQDGMQTGYRNSISAASAQRSNRQTKTRRQFNHLTESLDLAVSEVRDAGFWLCQRWPTTYFLRQRRMLPVHYINLHQTVDASSYSVAISGLFPTLVPSVEHSYSHQSPSNHLQNTGSWLSAHFCYLSNVWPKHLQS